MIGTAFTRHAGWTNMSRTISARAPLRLIIAVLAWLAPGLAAAAKEWKEVRIASEGARPPYNYLDPNGELMGFEIDLGQELCKRMSVTCIFVAQDWDGLFGALKEKRVDALMAAIEITDERLESIDFSKPYVKMPNTFIVGRPTEARNASSKALKGKTIGVEADGPHQTYLENVYPESPVKAYGSLEDAILDLAEARIDAVFGDKDAVMDFMKTRREAQCCMVLDDVPRDPTFFSEGIGVGVRQADQDLKAMFNKALDEAIADGAYSRVRTKYFDFTIR